MLEAQSFLSGGAIQNAMRGSDSGITSFTERMAIKQARKKDAAENLRRFEMIQAQKAEEQLYQRGRQSVLDNQNLQTFNNNLEAHKWAKDTNAFVQKENQIKMNQLEQGVKRQEELPTVLDNVPTEMTDEINLRYKIINDKKIPQADKDIAIKALNESIVNAYDTGDINPNEITNANQWMTRAATAMQGKGYTPEQIDASIKTRLAGLTNKNSANATALESGYKLADQVSKDKVAQMKEKGGGGGSAYRPSSPKLSDVFTKDISAGLDTVYGNTYKTRKFKKNKDGSTTNFNFPDNNRLVGDSPGAQAKFMNDLATQHFTYINKKKEKKQRYLSKDEIRNLIQGGIEDNIFNADQIDAEHVFKNAADYVMKVGAGKYQKNLDTIHKEQQKDYKDLSSIYKVQTAEDKLNKFIGSVKKKP